MGKQTANGRKPRRAVEANVSHKELYEFDNLLVLRGINSGTIDFVYVDNPYEDISGNGAAEYEVEGEDIKTLEGCQDLWDVIQAAKNLHSDRMADYVEYIAIRLIEIKRVLKPKGNVFVYCDLISSYYLRDCLAVLFGRSNSKFHREVIFCGERVGNFSRELTDKVRTLFGFSKDADAEFHPLEPVGGIEADNANLLIDEKVPKGQQPVSLLKSLLHIVPQNKGLALDPFVGSGTTCLAAESIKDGKKPLWKWVAIDNDPKAIATATKELVAIGETPQRPTSPPQRTDK